jgi:hypothetical protein
MSEVEKIKDLPEKVSSPENAEGVGHHGLSQGIFQAFRFTLKKLKKIDECFDYTMHDFRFYSWLTKIASLSVLINPYPRLIKP